MSKGKLTIGKVTNAISNYANLASSAMNKVNALVSTDSTNSSIRDRYTGGFYGDTTQFNPKVFSRLFDEPTYLTFRIEFDFKPNKIENLALASYGSGDQVLKLSQNYIPRPLLAIDDRKPNSNESLQDIPYYVENNDHLYYSTSQYLRHALGEVKRAEMLEGFVKSLQDITYNYAYYFTEISGLNNLDRIDPASGQRLLTNDSVITINCIEGLDLKITQLLQIYRKVVWDDVYQRWILPDMMRFFDMNIYVSEMRLFHTPSKSASSKNFGRTYDIAATMNATSLDKATNSVSLLSSANSIVNTALGMSQAIFGKEEDKGLSKVLNDVNSIIDTTATVKSALRGGDKLCNNAINNVMPTIVYHCEMCEFDISDSLSYLSSLGASKANITDPVPALVIKVGNVKQEMYFPLQNGLSQGDHNNYTLSKKDSYTIQNKMFSDEELVNDNTCRRRDLDLQDESLYPTHMGNRINPIYKGATGPNATTDSIKFSMVDEAYDPFTPDKLTVITAILGGVGSLFQEYYKSEAIDGEYAKKIKESINGLTEDSSYNKKAYPSEAVHGQYRNDLKNTISEFYKTGEYDRISAQGARVDKELLKEILKGFYEVYSKNRTPDNFPKSTAVDEAEFLKLAKVVFGEKMDEIFHHSTAIDDAELIESLKDAYGKKMDEVYHHSTATEDAELNTYSGLYTETDAEDVNSKFPKSTAVDEAAEHAREISNEITELHKSTATTPLEKELQDIIHVTSEEDLQSAATSIKSMIKYIEDNEIVKSVATHSDRNDLKDFLLNEMLETIVESTATDKNSEAVKRLASFILDNNKYVSTATNLTEEKRKEVIEKSGFSYLN